MTDLKKNTRDDEEEIEESSYSDEEAEELTQEQLQFLRQRLIEERAAVKEKLDRHLSEAVEDSDNLPDEMDLATRQSEQAYLLRLADKEKKLLTEIDHALSKFERGTYGYCEGTEEPIGFKRLSLRPWTRHSLEHKERLEREKGGRGR